MRNIINFILFNIEIFRLRSLKNKKIFLKKKEFTKLAKFLIVNREYPFEEYFECLYPSDYECEIKVNRKVNYVNIQKYNKILIKPKRKKELKNDNIFFLADYRPKV
jgi:hypothetical protein